MGASPVNFINNYSVNILQSGYKTINMANDWITTDDYKNILQCRFNNDSIHFLDAELKPISENDEEFMGEHYKLKITYETDGVKEEVRFFVKTKPKRYASQKQILTEMNCYEKEIFLYDFMFKEYAKYGFDTSFSAKSYLCIRGETLVLEDMTLKNFRVPERQTFYDMPQVKCLLKAVALFHGAAFAYEKVKSKELGKPFSIQKKYANYVNELFFSMYTGGSGFGKQWFDSSKQSFETLIDQLPQDTEYKESFKKMMWDAKLGKAFADETGVTKICGHGDLWSNNMLFRFENNVAQECCLVDYQIIRYYYPGFDVLLVVYFNTDAAFRSKHAKELYQYYYETLGDILTSYGFNVQDILPLDDFYKGMELCKLEALMQVATANAMAFIPADMLTKVAGDNMKDETDVEASLKKIKYYICSLAFKNDEKYRKIITENLYDLYDVLRERVNED